ncbi:MAG: AmmeMemoRadiSam system protein B, partial [Phycisphaerae bacterium]|nr:AmmeMemoRadiSam system protein B [Phycisphaerae bacterium]
YEGAFRIVPCMIPPSADAVDWGASLGRLLADWPEPVGVIASSDLTHYGPNYRFAPQGVGEEGRRWAHEVNDRRILDLIEQMDAPAVVPEAQTNRSACGGGAIAATMTAVQQMGATRGYLLEHSDSVSELARVGQRDPSNSVGYAGIVFG